MKLLRVDILKTPLCGGLLSGLKTDLRPPGVEDFTPLCLVGPNGSGKSQFLQSIAEAFQIAYHELAQEPRPADREEREIANRGLRFRIEYEFGSGEDRSRVAISYSPPEAGRSRKPVLSTEKWGDEGWELVADDKMAYTLLPSAVVAYTSGSNETLSTPFMVSRGEYADAVKSAALKDYDAVKPEPRLRLIDHETHHEVLLANLLLGSSDQRTAIIEPSRVEALHSFKLVVQLAHKAAPGTKRSEGRTVRVDDLSFDVPGRKRIQLTAELEACLEKLRRCATCWDYDENNEAMILDFLVDEETRRAFAHFWPGASALYASLHKLAMLNDLVIDREAKREYIRALGEGRLAARLSGPQERDKVFRILDVRLWADDANAVIDYIGLSDGEHQSAQILGMFAMYDQPNVLFMLDEPESHFNPEWRVEFMSRVMEIAGGEGKGRAQECLLTTHSPFVPSDLDREQVFVFSRDGGKVTVNNPEKQTFGATFDSIVENCFGVKPPISKKAMNRIDELLKSNDPGTVKEGLGDLGESVERIFLSDHLRQLSSKTEA